MEKKNIWELYGAEELKEIEVLASGYRNFLDRGKTERECIDITITLLQENGYRDLDALITKGTKLTRGDKVYRTLANKLLVAFNIGKLPCAQGMNILGAHVDSPRLDIKQNPLYEEDGIAYLDTHYYGGVKKYQWVTIPLALHGVVVKKDGTTVTVNIGEKEDDPVFFVPDLLPHLAREQMEKKASKVIEGEALDIVIGNRPLIINENNEKVVEETKADAADSGKDLIKKNVLAILKQNYDIEEEDFISAELEVVPAGRAREAGFDRSMILAYGQDDRVCAYPGLIAMLETADVAKTACLIFADKEEIGSVGATGMHSRFFENTVAELMNLMGEYNELDVRRTLASSAMLSIDVGAAYDPIYKSSFDKRNASLMGAGVFVSKFGGSGGKSRSNDADAEYLGYLRRIFDENGIRFQTAELGKVDAGGGGTIAYILANYGMKVIDSGIAIMNMHAPWEASSKVDIYEAKRAWAAFLRSDMMTP
ncbi:MAG: aminopeptidase [Lachnospiraceae bacterium]|jgi:aspartyl aminopeptidase|nr:aminopeptidase [Lachnospiraceae bacterium]